MNEFDCGWWSKQEREEEEEKKRIKNRFWMKLEFCFKYILLVTNEYAVCWTLDTQRTNGKANKKINFSEYV